MEQLTIPTIHMNGSGQRHLTQAYAEARDAVVAAIASLSPIAPHGRDYYPQGDGALEKAIVEHRSRIDRLRSVREELALILESLA
jgi:hypothetical protein